MAYGPLSVGSDDAFSLITDQTLTKQDVAADAKAAGDAIAKKFDKAGGTIEGNIKFPDIGDTATSKKLIWAGSSDGAEIYYQTTAKDQGSLVINLLDDANCFLRLALNGVFKSYFSPSDGNFHGNVTGKADSAATADNATHADSASKATLADNATHADNAAHADAATRADNATKAATATKADTATNATNAVNATNATNAITAGNVGGYKIRSQTSDPGAGSTLASGDVLLIYE